MKKGIMKTKGWYIIKTITWIWYGIAYPLPHPLWLIFMNELVLFIFFMKQFFQSDLTDFFSGNGNKKSVRMEHSLLKLMFLTKYIHFGYVKLHSFHGNLLGNFKDWWYTYKNTHVSPATYAKTLKLVSNYFEDVSLLHDGRICKLSNSNIHKF